MSGISVIVASFRRPDALKACLAGLRDQARAPDEILVVCRAFDSETCAIVDAEMTTWPGLRRVDVEEVGTVAAYNAGLLAASQAIVAYVDDDAVPTREWCKRIHAHFATSDRIAAVGGRDQIMIDGEPLAVPRRPFRRQVRVGLIQPFGRMIANHHIGEGPARDVDVLKGVNMSFRRGEVIEYGFDRRMRGAGAQVHSELTICLPLRKRGLRIIYDPSALVMHYPAARLPGDERGVFSPDRVRDSSHNEALAIIEYLGPGRRAMFFVWGILIGGSEAPGLLSFARDLARRRPFAAKRLLAAQIGRFAAWRTWRTEPRSPLADAGDGVPAAFPDGHMYAARD